MVTFDTAFERVLGHEGGYTMDLNDPGGETKWGISKRSYPDLDIRSLTIIDAKAIYKRDFWDKLPDTGCSALQFQMFDFAVNSGLSRAVKMLQATIGVTADGQFGPASKAALSKRLTGQASVASLVAEFLARRLEFYVDLPTWQYFSGGWARRIAKNMRFANQDLTWS